jgi:hypothetical protein
MESQGKAFKCDITKDNMVFPGLAFQVAVEGLIVLFPMFCGMRFVTLTCTPKSSPSSHLMLAI